MNRRKLLQVTGLALAGSVAGCSGGDSGTAETDTTVTTATDSPTETATTTATDSPTETATPTATEPPTATETPTPQQRFTPSPTYDLVVDSVGVSAWTVLSDESGSVAPTGTENPTLTVETGVRYEMENRGREFHPFALRAADDSPLLSQEGDGRFEDDPDVNWVDDGATLAFTVSEALAAAVDHYICTVHSSMRGDVETT